MRDGSTRALLDLVVDLLGYEANQASAVALRVAHVGVDVDLVAVASDAAAQGGMHVLYAVEVASGDEYEISRDWFGLGECSRRALRAAADGQFLLLHGDQ